MDVNFNDQTYACCAEMSQKDFTGKDLKDMDLNGRVIYASCFSQEIPDSEIFPQDMVGVTFLNCNLDNCVIPEGNLVLGGSNRRFEAQTDGNDWEIDENFEPTRPLDWERYEKFGLPMPSPDDLP